MPCLFINQQIKTNTNDGSLPIIETYADAILRTFASLDPSLLEYHRYHTGLPTVSVYYRS